MPSRIKVFHLEDYTIMRDGIRFLLSQDKDMNLVGEAHQGEQFLKIVNTVDIDVLLLDIYLDSMEHLQTIDGFEICKRLQKIAPSIKVIAHSVYDDADRVATIFKAGALGFVSKKAGYAELIHAIKIVHSGKKYICQETSKKLKNLNQFLAGLEDTLESTEEFFSKREKEVLALLASGASSREIAKKLFITEKTVESHRKNLVQKAKVKNTVELITYASLRGLIKK
ncbi:LuxR C-terminal-related transcriptional regulator [Chryseosolibacter indicus]|uniref:Response regulator transcription factor n=1 Tax=Chryseosolibacter indicus TaxID=2782351 RepID=A0ABS5VLC1_9BACT|nr:response regulator transcription factor [Chryseosolibacter indicus]MBT1702252.1 response regulator transcription factor [Chryseosolibacter indicus]